MIVSKIIGKTKDTKDPVFQCKTEKSFLEGCITDDGLNIWVIWSEKTGDFKKMMNHVVRKYKKNNIEFVQVISLELINKLKGFTLRKEIFSPIPEIKEEILVLEGQWILSEESRN